MAWVDYRKAFDLVPHEWIMAVMKAIRAPKEVRRTLKSLISLWRTEVVLETKEEFRLSHSPLLFCLTVALPSGRNRGSGVRSMLTLSLTNCSWTT